MIFLPFIFWRDFFLALMDSGQDHFRDCAKMVGAPAEILPFAKKIYPRHKEPVRPRRRSIKDVSA